MIHSILSRVGARLFGRRRPKWENVAEPIVESGLPVGGPGRFDGLGEPALRDFGEPPRPRPAATVDTQAVASALRADLALSFDWLRNAEAVEWGGADFLRVVSMLENSEETIVPQIAGALRDTVDILQDPEGNFAEAASVIRRDPSLTSAVLARANSAYYAPTEPIVCVDGAVSRLGASGTLNTLMYQVAHSLVCRPGPPYGEMPTKVWTHSEGVARLARHLAPALGAPPEACYTAGLLHDVGKLIIFDHIQRTKRELRRDVRVSRIGTRLLLDVLHGPLAGVAALEWNLGGGMARTLAGHHRHATPSQHDPVGETVYLADRTDIIARRGLDLDVDTLFRLGHVQASGTRVVARLETFDFGDYQTTAGGHP